THLTTFSPGPPPALHSFPTRRSSDLLRALTILMVMLVAVHAETPAEALRAMVDAERKFYQTGQEKGTRAAFLEFLADDAIVFRRSEEHTSELQSQSKLVCRLLLEKKQ